MKINILFLFLIIVFFTKESIAEDCTDITADDATTIISANCTDLDISGDGTTTTIDSGVTTSNAFQ